jgi:hypothetical protein
MNAEHWKEIKTRQRSRDRNILGHMNTSYFHAIPNKRFRKKQIECLIGSEGPIHDSQVLIDPMGYLYILLRCALGYYYKTFQ